MKFLSLFLFVANVCVCPLLAQHTVQYASLTQEADANAVAKGIPGAFVVPSMVKGKQYYRVKVRYGSPAEAQAHKGNGFVTQDGVGTVPASVVRPPVKTFAKTASKPPLTVVKSFPAPVSHPSLAVIRMLTVRPIAILPNLPTQPALDSLPDFQQPVSDAPLPQKASASSSPAPTVPPNMKLYLSKQYQLFVPTRWQQQTVTYADCDEGILFLPSEGGAAMQVFILGPKIADATDKILVDYTVDVMTRLAGVPVLATEPVRKENRLEFDLKLRGHVIGKGVVVRGEGKSLLFWAISRPDDYATHWPMVEQALTSLRIK
ncbi:MAG: hypothetical protein JST84_04620 [Acidobacteria bacterium]|nr:hypothetical protein [Acidobacteriota bacterium]